MSKSYAVVYYTYGEEFRYNVIYTDDNYRNALYRAYYKLLNLDIMYYISVIESDELSYLENIEALYDDPSYYTGETQEEIEDCDIVNIIEDLK